MSHAAGDILLLYDYLTHYGIVHTQQAESNRGRQLYLTDAHYVQCGCTEKETARAVMGCGAWQSHDDIETFTSIPSGVAAWQTERQSSELSHRSPLFQRLPTQHL